MGLASVIAAHLAGWETAVVELETFGTDDPHTIATAIERMVTDSLGAAVADCLFYRSSVGSVAGLELDDGRRVVIKAHQPRVSRQRLAAVGDVMLALSEAGFPCPRPLVAPVPLVRGLATAETLMGGGEARDGHDPAVRRELARLLAELVALAMPTPARESLGASWFSGLPADRLWPRPHSPLFDFEATRAGAEAIDALAAEARRAPRAGARVVGHFDWRTEHVRFAGDRVVAVFDWDSLLLDLEPVAVGAAAHAFCTDWERDALPAAPSAEEARAFVADYEDARGRRFEGDERLTLAGSLVYSLAYTARCVHAIGAAPGDRGRAFVRLLEDEGATLLRGL
jgi:Ser/Thr protein kinase RdoA (MazF antagonist)